VSNPTPRRFKATIYEQLARIGKAVASPRRLELLDLLAQSPHTVERLARKTGQSTANASQHLQLLRRARLVETQKQGLYVTYRLSDDGVAEFYRALRLLGEARLAEIGLLTRDFLAARGILEAVDREALVGRVKRGEVAVVDVRPVEEYQAGHIPGAVSLPLRELERRLAELPTDREIVAYCRGPYCILAVEAVERLRARGFRAVRLEDGVPDWRARGLPVAVGLETR
jgi:rhodanese-related sulfurtransferase/DNA-binding transcriptional ArsR family regulator